MTHHTILRIALTTAVALTFSALSLGEEPVEPADPVAYAKGTVTQIPLKTVGKLDLEDKDNLHFRYEGADFAIPYDTITSYQWAKVDDGGLGSQVSSSASKVGQTLLPMFFKKTKYLTISFKPENDATAEQMVFQVPKELVKAADPILKAWTDRNNAIPTADLAINPEDTWWGNRYWKTKRNSHLWNQNRPRPRGDARVSVANREDEE